MPDMLVKLYHVPSCEELVSKLDGENILIKRALPCDLSVIREFIEEKFSRGWADEATRAVLNLPSTCYIATQDGKMVGFACYDATGKAFFGPTGVDESMRGKGVGKVLYLKCLRSMYEAGYAYGIVGDAGPVDFYAKTSDAMVIPDCWPGEYGNMVGYKK